MAWWSVGWAWWSDGWVWLSVGCMPVFVYRTPGLHAQGKEERTSKQEIKGLVIGAKELMSNHIYIYININEIYLIFCSCCYSGKVPDKTLR